MCVCVCERERRRREEHVSLIARAPVRGLLRPPPTKRKTTRDHKGRVSPVATKAPGLECWGVHQSRKSVGIRLKKKAVSSSTPPGARDARNAKKKTGSAAAAFGVSRVCAQYSGEMRLIKERLVAPLQIC